MNDDPKARLAEALRLTRAGRLTEAGDLLRRGLGRNSTSATVRRMSTGFAPHRADPKPDDLPSSGGSP